MYFNQKNQAVSTAYSYKRSLGFLKSGFTFEISMENLYLPHQIKTFMSAPALKLARLILWTAAALLEHF